MHRRDKQGRGFSLIEAAVAIAIIAILAAAAAPMVLKALNQQREARARDEMKMIYNALFGANDPSTPSLRNDFGYAGSPNSLGWLVARPGGIRTYAPYQNPNNMLSGGWRGPYWVGSVNAAGQPKDPWGHPYIIRSTTGWQVLSMGANGRNDTNNSVNILLDDLAYPVPAVSFSNGTLNVNVLPASVGANPSATVVAITPSASNTPTRTTLTETAPLYTSSGIPPGQVVVEVSVGASIQYQSTYLPSGGTRNLTFYF